MNELSIIHNYLPSMKEESIGKVRILESESSKLPQINISTSHIIHGGMYCRTILIPAGVLLTGALIKIATILIVYGDVTVFIGDESLHLVGYNILPASKNRKQAFVTHTDTYLSMIFPSDSQSVEEVEKQFTDEIDILMSRKNNLNDKIIITGE